MSGAPGFLRKYGALLAAASICVLHFVSFDIGRVPLVTDVRFFVYFAWRIGEGAVPHLSYFENKTQLASFVGALFYRTGELLGLDPLMAIRAGYLLIAAAGGLALFFVFKRIGRGSDVAGLLGVLAYCSFGLLGLMPAIGNIPKLLMAVSAPVAALLAYDRRWFLAGVVGGLAFMDWQVGGLVGLGVLVAALIQGETRLRATGRIVAGGLTGLAPFVLYYAAHGALSDAVRQVIGSSLFRGSAALAEKGIGERVAKIVEVVGLACPAQGWLFFLGLVGMALLAWWAWSERATDRGRLLLPLAVYHFGIVAFSLLDFQLYGDFFALLHSVAFSLGIVWLAIQRFVSGRVGPGRQNLVAAACLLIALVAGRPSFLRPPLELVTRTVAPGTTLQDQREVAEQLRRIIDGSENRRALILDHNELLFLTRSENALPAAYWNRPYWGYVGTRPGETFADAGVRVTLSAGADVVIPPRFMPQELLGLRGYITAPLASQGGRYRVNVAILREEDR